MFRRRDTSAAPFLSQGQALGIAMLIVASAGVGLGDAFLRPIKDPDTWWHLRIGEEFLRDWSLSNPGQLTPFATRDWFATQWTTEILALKFENWFGPAGVVWLSVAGVLVLISAIYFTCRERATPLISAGATVLAVAGTIPSLAPRPQVLTFVFVAVVLGAWLKTSVDLRARWWLVPLSWLWAATHGMWFLGVMIGVVAVLGMAMDRSLPKARALRLLLVPGLSLIAAGLTPVGPKLLLAPFATSKMTGFITEWMPPDFHALAPLLVLGGVAIVAVSYARLPEPASWFDLLLVGLGVLWLVAYARTVAVGSVLIAPFVATAAQSWRAAGTPPPTIRRLEGVGLGAGMAVVAIVLAAVAWQRPALETSDAYFPTSEVDTLIGELPEGSVIFNTAELGGWLEWRHRHVVPVADGLTDAYEVDYYSDYVDALNLERGWYDFVQGTEADFALVRTEQSIAPALEDRGWRIVAEEEQNVLLAAPNGG